MARVDPIRIPGHDSAGLRHVGGLDTGLRKEPEWLSDPGGVRLHGPVSSRSYYFCLVRSWFIIIFAGATATGAAQALFRGHW